MRRGPWISLSRITKQYDRGSEAVEALRGIDLEVAPGEYVAFMGPSGSGKTTLMEILGCLARPTTGSYLFDGRRVDTSDERYLAALRGEEIGFVFQTFNLLPRLTAVENVELPLLYRRVGRRERRVKALALLERVGLTKRALHRPNELSGGEQQRVAIARALVTGAKLVLADEPTGNLDSGSGAEILALLEGLHGEGHTLALVTHDAAVAARPPRIVRMRDGRVENEERRV